MGTFLALHSSCVAGFFRFHRRKSDPRPLSNYAETPSVAWNPNNQSVAVAAGGSNSSKEYSVRFVDIANGNVREFGTEHPFLPRWDQLQWVDTSSLRVGGIVLSVPADASAEIGESELGVNLKRGQIAYGGSLRLQGNQSPLTNCTANVSAAGIDSERITAVELSRCQMGVD